MKRIERCYGFKAIPKKHWKDMNALFNEGGIDWIHAGQCIKAWKQLPATKSVWLSKKRKSLESALREFKKTYNPVMWHFSCYDGDDTFEVHYQKELV